MFAFSSAWTIEAMLTMPTLAKPTVHLFNFIRSSDKLSGYGFWFRSLIVHYRGQNLFAQVTEGQFIDYQPNYASVFFGSYWATGW